AGNPVGNYVPLPGPVKMTAISAGPGYPWLFAIGADNQVYMQRFNANGDPVGGWVLIPNPVKAILKGFYANPGLFVIGTDDQVYVHQFDYNGNPVGSYIPIPNPVKAISATTAIAEGSTSGTALLSVIGTDDQVYLHKFDVNGNATGDYIRINP